MSTRLYDPVLIARQFLYIREAQSVGQNRGLRVEAIQKWAGGSAGDSWCMEMVWVWLDLSYHGTAPIPRMQACQDLHVMAMRNGWIVETPKRNDLCLSVNAERHAHHVGLVTMGDPLTVIAGNTSKDGQSSNGDGVYEHLVNPEGKVFVRFPD